MGLDAADSPLVNFSGTLTDINGKPLTSIAGVTFSLYNDQQALSPLWMETQNVTPDKNGRYSVQVGATSTTGLPADIFVAAAGPQIAASWRPCPSRPVSPPIISVAG